MLARTPAMVIFLAVALSLCGQEAPTIRVPVRLVTVPALVFSSDNRLIPDLQPSNFRLFDNGQVQRLGVETAAAPMSVVVAVQVNLDVRQYVGFVAKTGSVIDALLAGASGEAAVITYGDDVRVIQPFGGGDVGSAFRAIKATGKSARAIDAGFQGVRLLAGRPVGRRRILLMIGQSMDSGSESRLDDLRQYAEKESVSVFALCEPLAGAAFVSDTFWLNGVSQAEKGGIRAGADMVRLGAVLKRKADADAGTDPWTVLIRASGGAQLPFRTQRQLEAAIAEIGVQLRGAYVLTYYPAPAESGYHTIRIEVDVPGAKVSARQGYWLNAN